MRVLMMEFTKNLYCPKLYLKRLNAELFVHSEVNANELGFSGLSPEIFSL